jgi:hypothetical protein
MAAVNPCSKQRSTNMMKRCDAGHAGADGFGRSSAEAVGGATRLCVWCILVPLTRDASGGWAPLPSSLGVDWNLCLGNKRSCDSR